MVVDHLIEVRVILIERDFDECRGSNVQRLIPDDVRMLVVPCLAHRILPAGASGTTFDMHDEAAAILEGILDEVESPV